MNLAFIQLHGINMKIVKIMTKFFTQTFCICPLKAPGDMKNSLVVKTEVTLKLAQGVVQ